MTPADLTDAELHRLLNRSWHKSQDADNAILANLQSRGLAVRPLGVFLLGLVAEQNHRQDAEAEEEKQ